MKREFRQGERHPFRADAAYIQHLKDTRSPEQMERDEEKANALHKVAVAGAKQKAEKQAKQKAAREANRERKQGPNFHPGGKAQSESAAEKARAAMIERHEGPGPEREYVTPGEAYDTFMKEPHGFNSAAEAREQMIARQEKRDVDQSKSQARRSPERNQDSLLEAARRDVRDAMATKPFPTKYKAKGGSAAQARAQMIERMK